MEIGPVSPWEPVGTNMLNTQTLISVLTFPRTCETLLIFLSHSTVSPLPTVHVHWILRGGVPHSSALPPAWPSTLCHLFALFSWPACWIMSLSLRAWNFKPLPWMAIIFANVCLKLCLIVKTKECTSDSRYTHVFMRKHTFQRMQNVTTLVTLNLLRLEQQITRHCTTLWSHSDCCVDRWSSWLTPALTLRRCKYSTHIIPMWASGHRSTVTFRFNLYTSSAIWSPSQPTSPNAGLCLHFYPTARCLPRVVAGLLLPPLPLPSPQPVRQNMPFDSRLRLRSTAAEALWRTRLGPWGRICTIEVHTAVVLNLAAVLASETKSCICILLYL